MRSSPEIAFLFIGGEHHVAHLAPVAAAISLKRRDICVTCYCADVRTHAALDAVARAMGAGKMRVVRMSPPRASGLLARLMHRASAAKGPMLAKIRWMVRDAVAIVAPERTSAALRWMGWRRPLIHVRHGAGDRVLKSEARLTAFDLVLVAAQKYVDRVVALGVDRAKVRAVGYVKLDYLRHVPVPDQPLFDNDRPVVVYNPHFDGSVSSLGIAKEVIARFAGQDRYNLVFAPHVRAFEDADADERVAWEALAVPGKVRIDLGSPMLFNMAYMRAGDLYLGDVSSQLYEFLVEPRPAVFLNPHGVDWAQDPAYIGWKLGEVAGGADDVLDAVDRAIAREPERARAQARAMADAFGDYEGAIERAADAIIEQLFPVAR